MNEEQQHIALAKWLEGTLSAEEEARLAEVVDLENLRATLSQQENFGIATRPTASMWEDMQQHINSSEMPKHSNRKWWWIVLALLCVALLGGLLYMTFFAEEKVKTAPKETQEIIYADGTRIQLSPSSEVRYDASNWKVERRIALKGQAFFEVTKGATFTVESTQGTIQVLGTQFDIWLGDDAMRVQCFEGSVEVRAASGQTILEAGQQVRVNKNRLVAVEALNSERPDWLSGERIYEKDKIADILDDLTRFYDLNIQAKNVDTEIEFSGVLPTNDLQKAVRYLADSMGWTYEIQANNILFSAE